MKYSNGGEKKNPGVGPLDKQMDTVVMKTFVSQ